MKPRASSRRYLVDLMASVGVKQTVNGHAKGPRITKESGDIAELDARLGKIRNGADGITNIHSIFCCVALWVTRQKHQACVLLFTYYSHV